eukprot:TRINITY_DN12057_c3_g1_i2.p3 TRINITY_DN12057_c3_g1~~TRINITY_DN12057_c3_g1_i2.p3  ORF type:complete len:150 (+),score=19.11 TRINITY_DN12057_c3_g1_i2:2343-2792(+)
MRFLLSSLHLIQFVSIFISSLCRLHQSCSIVVPYHSVSLYRAAYHSSNGTTFVVPEGTIAFSVVLFSIFAIVWYATLMYRRSTSAIGAGYSSHPENGEGNADNSDAKPQGAELGGAEPYRTMTVVLFVVMWFTYILLSALVAYGDVQGF